MSTVVTGATGHLGRLVVEDLLDRGVPASDVVATGRSIEKLDDLAARGVTVRRVDFDDPATLDGAFAAGDRVLLVSGSELGRRVPQHRAVIDAAAAAGVAQLVYTSAPKASTTPMQLATEHRLTEEAVAASGLPATILRNDWYLEGYAGLVPTYLEHGAILGSAGDGRVSGATRSDLAEAAAVVLSAPVEDHVGRTYELGGDESFSFAELAAAVSEATGQTVVYADVPPEEHRAALVAGGVPEAFVDVLVDVDQATKQGALELEGHDLSTLLGRPTKTLAEVLAG
ncbi:MAG TPA: SDR family oxidoreductase [Acidimicrobiales bacterium]|nr:SDR family oxidoreductase [Acidimicrobiales bacterium]